MKAQITYIYNHEKFEIVIPCRNTSGAGALLPIIFPRLDPSRLRIVQVLGIVPQRRNTLDLGLLNAARNAY